MNVGVNYMREHMPDDARVHYAYLDAGGVAPNVVQHQATVRQLVRARDLPGLRKLVERVKKIAEGAALMTETKVESKVFTAVSNLLGNRPLEEAMQTEMDRLGPVEFDDDDRAFAKEIQGTLTEEEIAVSFRRVACQWTSINPFAISLRHWTMPAKAARAAPMSAIPAGPSQQFRPASQPVPSEHRFIPGKR